MELTPSHHAEERMQNRAISWEVIDLLIDYGRIRRSRGADSYCLDKKSRRRLRDEIGRVAYSRLERRLDCYVVISDDGSIITAAHRLKRTRH